jgi:hypothetical protein
MAAVDETITGNGVSTVFTPSNGVSEFMVFGFTGKGSISLIEITTAGTEFSHGTVRGSSAIATPDNGNTYKFQAHNVDGDVNVYMGP